MRALINLLAAAAFTAGAAAQANSQEQKPDHRAGQKHDQQYDDSMTASEARVMFQQVQHSLGESIRTAEQHANGKAVSAKCLMRSNKHTSGDQQTSRNQNEPGQNQPTAQHETGKSSVVCVVTLLTNDNKLTEVQVCAESGKVLGQRQVQSTGGVAYMGGTTMLASDTRTIDVSGDSKADARIDARTDSRDAFAPPRRWQKATDLTGKRITNNANEDLGTLNNIVVDARSGRILYGVVSFGGFLGLGDKLFAVPWNSLQLTSDAKEFTLNVDRERLKNAEGFDQDKWPNFADQRWATTTHQHYGQKPYWDQQAASGDSYRDRWNQHVVVWQKTTDLCGKDVRSPSNQDLGTMSNLAIDPDSGRILYGILKHRGKLFAVPWNAVNLSTDAKHFTVNVEPAALSDAIAFTEDRWPNLTDQRWAQEVHVVYHVSPYWIVERR